MVSIIEDLQRPYIGELVTLYQLDCTKIGGEVYYFTATAETGGVTEVVFDGITYTAVEIDADGFEYNGQGAFPTPTLRLSNVTSFASSLVIANEDLLGATLVRIRTLKRFLDSGDSPDPLQIFAPDVYTVEQKTVHNRRMIEWKLSASIDQQGLEIPSRKLVRDYCDNTYRVWDPVNGTFNYNHATCPYNESTNGGKMFTLTNEETLDPTLDGCPKTLPACQIRFGENAPLPFKGCPGLGRFR